ncbi:sensor histidine kinase [Robertmurraya andreesenii]|uniref:histidine kinase n=1 Tax=Anoxybacillus andreesenii TaxID=1325932 RepID=A0ABT9V292_9BACL|nr:ATP-binding protein [Robertmurraya andreesenii]MDQ0155077.1 signal transduction histidine kinase [Robertmurraya andreesenii]
MNLRSLSLSTKIWLTIIASILITVIFSYLLSNLFYEKLYVENLEKTLLSEGKLLANDYKGGPLDDELRERIEWYNSKNDFEVFVVSNPKELAACFPFETNHVTLIEEKEREQLLEGKTIQKQGFEERFNRKILAVIIPLLDDSRLEGIIYLYVPLARITELTKDFTYLWLIAAVLFLVISFYLGTLLVKKLTRPLQQMKAAADKLSKGDYSVRVLQTSDDEVGQLARAFNHMSSSIQKEDERKKEFLANVSHELRTPLSYVNGYTEALLLGIVKSEEEKEKYLALIHRESKRMERLVGDLLDLTKLETDEFQLLKTPLPLAQLVEEAIEKYRLPLKEKNIKLSTHLDPDIIILGDEGRMEQVIQNMMDNAMKYTEKGEITLHLEKHAEGCILSITDTGVGIPEKDLQHIKERFYRVNKARTRLDGGTGLGLAISDKIIALHQGKLRISSQLGKGTRVDIILPVLELDEL